MTTEIKEYLDIASVLIQIILFISLIVLVLILKAKVKILVGKVEVLHEDVTNFRTKLDPLIDDTAILVKGVNQITDKLGDGIDTSRRILEKVQNTVESINSFQKRIQDKVEPPIMDTINTYSAFVKGIRGFIDALKSRPSRIKREQLEEKYYDEDKLQFEDEIQDEFNDINKELNDVRKKLEEMKKV